MSGARGILLAEDDALDAELLAEALRRTSASAPLTMAADGADALDYLLRAGRHAGRAGPQPRLVLLDIKMPKMDGLEVLRRIKGDPRLKALPVVMLSSSRVVADVAAAYAGGVNGFVVKPLEFTDLVQAVGRLAGFWLLANESPPET